jgi:acetyl-CoA carboxylase carboxyl transferase subunit beta
MKTRMDGAQPRFTPRPAVGCVPRNTWLKCPACRSLIYRPQLQDNLNVCPACEHHFRLDVNAWLELLLDTHSFVEHEGHLASDDPLRFANEQTSYAQKLQQAQDRTGLTEALVCGSGKLYGHEIEVAVADFGFMGGSMGAVYGEKIARSTERAASRGVPLLTINASGGARMQEGLHALMQMAKVSLSLHLLAKAQLPHIAILADPCYGGVTASYATIADIVLAEPGAHIGFAGPRVIAQTIQQQLPSDFQSAELLLAHGMVDAVVHRRQMRSTLKRLLHIYQPPIHCE